MSFSSDVKEELTRVEPGCSHCERALLAAIIRIEGTLFFSGKDRYRLEVVTDAPYVARLTWRLLHETYNLKTIFAEPFSEVVSCQIPVAISISK